MSSDNSSKNYLNVWREYFKLHQQHPSASEQEIKKQICQQLGFNSEERIKQIDDILEIVFHPSGRQESFFKDCLKNGYCYRDALIRIELFYRQGFPSTMTATNDQGELTHISFVGNQRDGHLDLLCLCTGLENLYLRDLGLKTLPQCIGNLQNLEELALSGNHISEFPDSMTQLTKIKYLILDNMELQHLPKFIRDLRNLKEMYLMNNPNLKLPEWIIDMQNLDSLDVDPKIFKGRFEETPLANYFIFEKNTLIRIKKARIK